MAKALTAAAVERLKPAEERREIPDGGCAGLYLVIQPSGVKSFALRFRRPNGRPAKLTLGRVDLTNRQVEGEPVVGAPLTLAAARALATKLHHDRAHGRDVVAAKHRERAERAARGAKTFDGAVRDFIEQHAQRKTRRWQETARLLGVRLAKEGGLEVIPKSVSDRWRDRPVAEITVDDVFGVVDEARERGVPGLERRADGPTEARARAVYSALSKFFNWCVERRRITMSPVAGVARPDTPEARDRVLADRELAKFWKAAGAERAEFGVLLKLLLLTGCRLNEVSGMRRAELRDDGASWVIPGARTKNHREHAVPLPPEARELLAGVPTTDDLIFTTDGRHPVAVGSKVKRRLDAAMKVAPWRLHDLRRTAATDMAELGVAPHVVEAVLNHVSGHRAGVAGVYNRAQYAVEKRRALELWARYVGLVVDDDRRAAHEKFLGAGGDRAGEAVRAAVAEGGAQWDHYLKMIAGGAADVVALPRRRSR
jgi:integrase